MAFQLKAGVKVFGTGFRRTPGQYFYGYRIVRQIGEGKFGICYLVSDDKSYYILKQYKKKWNILKHSAVQYEEELLKQLEHEALPRFIMSINDKHLAGFLMEYKRGITLEAMIFDNRHVFTRNEIYNIGEQLIDILSYLHGKGIVHRDIRLSNLLFDGRSIYLVDFGAARRIDDKKYKADIDYFCFGDLLLHLFYTSFREKPDKIRPWYEELVLSGSELVFLKKLMGLEKRYKCIEDVKKSFRGIAVPGT